MNYFDEKIACPACGKETTRRDWPYNSNMKPRTTCCEGSGWNKKKGYKDRFKVVDGVKLAKCLHCEEHKLPDEFHKSGDKIKSMCKSCHKEKYGGIITPSRQKKINEAVARKEERDNKLILCQKCEKYTRKKDWPTIKSGGLAKYCCTYVSQHKVAEENKSLVDNGNYKCKVCKTIQPVDNFYKRKNKSGSVGYLPICKPCKKFVLIGVRKKGKERRSKLIEETSDGTLTPQVLRQLFIDQKTCLVCDTKMEYKDKTLDHIKPLSQGGKHSICNSVVICHSCNSSKNATDPKSWLESLDDNQKERYLNHIKSRAELAEVLQCLLEV